jgi:hypothetical protein
MTSSRVALILALIVPVRAWASGPTPEDFATARNLYKDGKDLRAAGDLKGAYEKLKAAHALGHTPLTGIELARTEVQLGMIVEAREVCLGVARMPVESDETERSAEARTSAAALAEELKPRIASVRIHVVLQHDAAQAIVTVDGISIPSAALDQPRMVNPGHHVVTAHVEGAATVTRTFDVSEGKEGAVELAPPSPAKQEKPQPQGETHHARLGGLIVGGLVVTGVGLFLGVAGGLYAMEKTLACPQNQCPPSEWQSLDDARAAATLSTIGFAVAGGGVVLLVIGLLTHTSPKETSRVRVMPHIGFGELGVRGAF